MSDFGDNLDFNDLEESINDPLEYTRRIASKVDRTEEQIDDIDKSMKSEEAERRADDLVLEMKIEELELESAVWRKEEVVADATDASNQFIDLQEEIITDSLDVFDGTTPLFKGLNYSTFSNASTGFVTRVALPVTLGNVYNFKYQVLKRKLK